MSVLSLRSLPALTLSALVVSLALVAARDASADATPLRFHLVGKVATGRTMVVDGPSGTKNVAQLPPWANVERLLVSPSGRHGFLFAQLAPHQSRTAFVVDLTTAKVTAAYRPGVGGEFIFAANDDVVQIAGCGTACASLEVRDTTGKSLGAYDCAGFDAAAEISPDRKLAACFDAANVAAQGAPQEGPALDVVDLTTGRPAASTKIPCTYLGQRAGFRWEGPSGARFTCFDAEVGDDVDVVVSWTGGRVAITKRAVQTP